MVRNLPPLNSLKAFEAAARLGSLVKAADELNVTHAAISRHVKSLEHALRTALFERTGRGVMLTEAGTGLARELTRGFDIIAGASARFSRPARSRQRLTVTCDVPFAMLWLVPRLGGFMAQHPQIDIILDPTHRLVDFAAEDVDLGIRYGGGTWRGMDAVKISDVEFVVVCSPGFLKRYPMSSPAQLPADKLIQEQDRSHWKAWLGEAGLANRVTPRGPTMLADLAITAAESGQGLALADRLIVSDAIRAGRLVIPFENSVRHHGYFAVSPAGTKLSRSAKSFRDWLLHEVRDGS